MRIRGRRQRGHLLIEFAVAAAVATAAVSATIATVISTAKSGREIETLTQAVSDVTAFAAYENNLHQMGGPNSGYGANIGDLAQDYVRWINNNYPVQPNGLVTIQSFSNPNAAYPGPGTSNGTLEVGNLGTAYGYPQTPAPGTFIWSCADGPVAVAANGTITDAGTNNMQATVLYAHAQAFVGLGSPNTGAGAMAGPGPDANGSNNAEAIAIFMSEDPGTGIVSVSPVYNFGTCNLTGFNGGVPVGTDLATLFFQTNVPGLVNTQSDILPGNQTGNPGTGTF